MLKSLTKGIYKEGFMTLLCRVLLKDVKRGGFYGGSQNLEKVFQMKRNSFKMRDPIC